MTSLYLLTLKETNAIKLDMQLQVLFSMSQDVFDAKKSLIAGISILVSQYFPD